MTAGRLGAFVPTLVIAIALAACGRSAPTTRTPDLSKLPLVPGASVVAQARQCDKGANAFCSFQLVVVDHQYPSSTALVSSERRQLRKRGWSAMNADTGEEQAAESPDHGLRVTYATAFGDLKGVDLNWIKRPQSIALALSHAMFARASAMSVMLEVGPS
jgi:hypothetical protein